MNRYTAVLSCRPGKLFVLLFLACWFGPTISLSAQQMPELERVVKIFFAQESFDSRLFYTLGFERRPEGYFVVRKNDARTIDDRALFYDATASTPTFLEVDIFQDQARASGPIRGETDQLAEAYLRNLGKFTTDAFARQPYFGYEGWYRDAIAYFEAKAELDLDQLHALARARSIAAASMLYDSQGYGLISECFDLPMGQSALSATQIEQYLTAVEHGLANYRELKTRDPNYITPVGKAEVKYANEVMYAYLNLLYYQNEETAAQMLEEDIYPADLLYNATNLLQSCPSNAILISYGDNDTYPLYYLQATMGLRQDVIIANSSLLVIPRYRQMLLGGPYAADSLQTRLPDNFYQEEIVFWGKDKNSEESLPLGVIYQQLRQPDQYYFNTFILRAQQVSIAVPSGITGVDGTPADSVLLWPAGLTNNYVYPDEFFVADALAANNWQRPICFTNTVRRQNFSPWAQYLLQEGLVYRLYPQNFGAVGPQKNIAVNLDASLRFWLEDMQIDSSTQIKTMDQLPFYQSNLNSAQQLATALAEAGRLADAFQLIESACKKYPNHLKAWDTQWLSFIVLLQQIDQQAAAKKMILTIKKNIKKNGLFADEPDRRAYLQSALEGFE